LTILKTFLIIVFDNYAMCFRFSIATDEHIQDREVSIKRIRWILQWKAKRKRLNSSDVVLAFLEVNFPARFNQTSGANPVEEERSLVKPKKAYFRLTLT